MSSNLFVFDGSIFPDPFSPFNDSVVSIDHILQENYSSNTKSFNQVDDEINQIASTFLSSSPPSHRMDNLSLYPIPHFSNEHPSFSSVEVKTEDLQVPFYSSSCNIYNNNYSSSFPSYGNELGKMMQRSFSNNCFDGKPSFMFQPRFDSLKESKIFSNTQVQALSSPEKTSASSSHIRTQSSSSHMRRVFSAGDLQSKKTSHEMRGRLSSSPLATEGSFMEEANSKVGRYSAEERKERIHRYRAKRTQRNFNKTIKYACRKTLADNRPRIRGRFARNDEPVDIPKTANFNRYEDDEDDLWMEGFCEEENEGALGRGGLHVFQYYMPTSN